MVSCFGRFLENFTDICAPLNMLKRKVVKFCWGPEQQKIFDKLKQMMISTPALHLPDYLKLFFLNCDASQVALGCALGQMHNGNWVLIGYAGRTLNKTESLRVFGVAKGLKIF